MWCLFRVSCENAQSEPASSAPKDGFNDQLASGSWSLVLRSKETGKHGFDVVAITRLVGKAAQLRIG